MKTNIKILLIIFIFISFAKERKAFTQKIVSVDTCMVVFEKYDEYSSTTFEGYVITKEINYGNYCSLRNGIEREYYDLLWNKIEGDFYYRKIKK